MYRCASNSSSEGVCSNKKTETAVVQYPIPYQCTHAPCPPPLTLRLTGWAVEYLFLYQLIHLVLIIHNQFAHFITKLFHILMSYPCLLCLCSWEYSFYGIGFCPGLQSMQGGQGSSSGWLLWCLWGWWSNWRLHWTGWCITFAHRLCLQGHHQSIGRLSFSFSFFGGLSSAGEINWT